MMVFKIVKMIVFEMVGMAGSKVGRLGGLVVAQLAAPEED